MSEDDFTIAEGTPASLGPGGYLWTPADLARRLVNCPKCGDTYINHEYLEAHMDYDHGKETADAERIGTSRGSEDQGHGGPRDGNGHERTGYDTARSGIGSGRERF